MVEVSETTLLIRSLPGGQDLLDWFGGAVHFHDAEVVELHLRRDGRSCLTLKVGWGEKATAVTFVLEQWIDVRLDGFSEQNVIFDLKLRPVPEREAEQWELGVGARFGRMEIELEPCFGANGVIRADISAITFARPENV